MRIVELNNNEIWCKGNTLFPNTQSITIFLGLLTIRNKRSNSNAILSKPSSILSKTRFLSLYLLFISSSFYSIMQLKWLVESGLWSNKSLHHIGYNSRKIIIFIPELIYLSHYICIIDYCTLRERLNSPWTSLNKKKRCCRMDERTSVVR